MEEISQEYLMAAKKIKNDFTYVPYKSIGALDFNMTKDDVTYDLLGEIFAQSWPHGIDRFVKYSSLGPDIQFYFDDDEKFYKVEYFQPTKFTINDKVYDIDYGFTIEDLKNISEDFVPVYKKDVVQIFVSKKLGICMCFDDEGHYDFIMFMTENYYNEEIDKFLKKQNKNYIGN